ncbi:cell division protein FtsQ [Pasteurellaceae bacterium 15-036681]|nr:cell division protein FtsQ [Pasteurellaceae bacterium 15-036681]
MMTVFRKKPVSVIRTKASKPPEPRNWSFVIKSGVVLVCVLFAYILYVNWSNVLNSLDRSPIKAYALTHKTQFTTNADIRGILAKEPLLKGYFEQDISEVREKFLELSWIRDVVVRKVYPDRLSLTLLEHKPVAIWNDHHYLSEEGTVFSLPEGRFNSEGLPILYGIDSEGKVVLDAWMKIYSDLKSRNLVLRTVAMDNRGSWTIGLENGVELRLGRGKWLPKIDRFVDIFPEIDVPDGKRLSYVDLRYDHGAAVGFSNQ